MEQPIRTAELASKASISLSYASEIANGKRVPSRPLAIHILRKTGWKHPVIAELTDDQVAVFEQIEPWSRRPTDAAA